MSLRLFSSKIFMANSRLPFFSEGEVVKGYGRGSKELGIPTANFPDRVVEALPKDLPYGVYYGWASIETGPIYKMVMSVGKNPQFDNHKRTMETHVIHKFKDDFYGSVLKIVMLGYIRAMDKYNSLDELIAAIQSDIAIADLELEKPEKKKYVDDNFFVTNSSHTQH